MVTFEINGRKVRPGQIANALEKELVKEIGEDILKKLRGVRCGEHGVAPKVLVKGQSLSALNLEIDTCCDQLMERAKEALEISG